MESPRFDFALPLADVTQTAPDGRAYVAGRSPQARHCSQKAAETLQASRETKTARYLALIGSEGPLSDHAAAERLGVPLSSVCSIRNGIIERRRQTLAGPWLEPCGEVDGPYGHRVTAWGLRT